jgi:hypothetical protein
MQQTNRQTTKSKNQRHDENDTASDKHSVRPASCSPLYDDDGMYHHHHARHNLRTCHCYCHCIIIFDSFSRALLHSTHCYDLLKCCTVLCSKLTLTFRSFPFRLAMPCQLQYVPRISLNDSDSIVPRHGTTRRDMAWHGTWSYEYCYCCWFMWQVGLDWVVRYCTSNSGWCSPAPPLLCTNNMLTWRLIVACACGPGEWRSCLSARWRSEAVHTMLYSMLLCITRLQTSCRNTIQGTDRQLTSRAAVVNVATKVSLTIPYYLLYSMYWY